MKLKQFKKMGAAALAVALSLSFVACSDNAASSVTSSAASSDASSEVVGGAQDATAATAALGFGLVSSAGEGEGKATATTTAAAVLVDEDGAIIDVAIDVAQNDVMSEGGVVTTPEAYLTKGEKGDDYGMGGFAAAGEWYVQVDALREYLIGKTAQDVAGIAINEETAQAADEDLLAGCTIAIPDFMAAVTLAMENATVYTSEATDTLSLAIDSTAKVTDATADADGSAQIDTNFVALVTDADGVVSAAALDVVQSKFTVSAADAITGAGEVLSKQQQGDDYGMAAFAEAGEWYAQAAVFTDYLVGMNAADIANIAFDGETFQATDADLLAGCTIKINGYVATATKAAQ